MINKIIITFILTLCVFNQSVNALDMPELDLSIGDLISDETTTTIITTTTTQQYEEYEEQKEIKNPFSFREFLFFILLLIIATVSIRIFM